MILETERLVLAELAESDWPLILALLNEPLWLKFIGDRGVHTPEAARAYLRNGPIASYAAHGFGLWAVRLKLDGTPVGICGLIKRATFDDVDIGFALLERFSGKGYATEAARASLHHGWEKLGLKRIVAITDSENSASIHVLEKIGLRFEKNIALPPDGEIGNLYAISVSADHRPAGS